MKARISTQGDGWLYAIAILISGLLSFWMNARDAVINPDAICYLITAEEIGRSGISHAMHVCGQPLAWPFFSACVYAVVQLTHLSYMNAAYLLNAIFTMISVISFIAIIKALGGSRLVMICAAVVILLSHEFNSVRQYIVRDHGFWAFYMLSILSLLRYFQRPSWLGAFAWSMSLVVAMLFRIEAAVFLLAMPFSIWLRSGSSLRQRFYYFIQLNTITLIGVLVIFAWVLMHPQQSLTALGRVYTLIDEWQYWLARTIERYTNAKTAMAQYVLPKESTRYAGSIFTMTAVSWYLYSVIDNLSWIYALLAVYAVLAGAAIFSRSAKAVILGYLLVNLLITVGFFAENLFLTKRYLMAMSLVMMCWAPFGLAALWQAAQVRRHRTALLLVSLALVGTSLGGIFDFGYSKTYVRDAAVWLAGNVPQGAELYANHKQMLYYATVDHANLFENHHRQLEQNKIAAAWWKQYDYVALQLAWNDKDPVEAVERGRLMPIKIFKNKRGDRVVIYQIPKNEKIAQMR